MSRATCVLTPPPVHTSAQVRAMRAGARFPDVAEQAAFVRLLRYIVGRTAVQRDEIVRAVEKKDMVSEEGSVEDG